MINRFLNKVNQGVTRFVFSPGDDKETLLRKKIWLITLTCFMLFFLADVLSNIPLKYFGVAVVDIIELSLGIIILTIFYFHRNHIERYGLYLQLMLVIFPSIKAYLYGGIFHAAGVEVVGLIGPIYALTFPNYRRAILIFFFYLAMVLGGSVIWEYLHPEPGLLNSFFFYLVLIRFTCAVGMVFVISLIYNLQIAKLKMQEEDRLKQLHIAKSKFYTNITHEFRTPLTIILGIADNISDKFKETLSKEVKMIKNNGNKLLRLVNQLLNLSKMEAGAMPVNMLHGDIQPYLKYLVESFHSIAEEKDIRIHFISNLDSIDMDYDPDIVEEMISNLLSNAIKFTHQGGNIYIQLETESDIRKGYISCLNIHIRDTGSGIAEDKLPYIFDRFYQVDDESTRKNEGSGIGLALVKEYINLIGGTIHVKSKIDEGTEFILRIPVTHVAQSREMVYKDTKGKYKTIDDSFESTDTPGAQMTEKSSDELPLLLIVEDNSDVIDYLLSVVNHEYQTIVAKNGDEGINRAIERVPDIIICDVMMPEKDGFEVCHVLKDDFRTNHIPIVMLTAKADIDSRIAGLEYGADAYLIKPFNKKELLVQLQKLIENRKKLKDKYGEMIFTTSEIIKPKGLNEIFLEKTIAALDQNYQDYNYSISKLCQDIGISRAQLHRKLIALTGRSTSNLIRQYRLKKAKELILTIDRTISEISYMVGFKDPNYFTKSFTREYGETPTQYRSENSVVKQ